MSERKSPLSSNVAALPESFLASVVVAPTSLQAAVIGVEMNKLPVRALLGTGSTESYIHEELLKEWKLKSQGELSRISLASAGSSSQVRGCVLVPEAVRNSLFTQSPAHAKNGSAFMFD